MKSYFKKLNPNDLIVVLFIILTGVYMLLGSKQLHHLSIHILIRILFLFIIFLLLKVDDSENEILLFLRHFYPLVFLGFFYSETDYYNNLLFENLDPILVHLEETLFNTHLSITFSERFSFHWFSELMHFGYFSYYLIILGIPLLFYVKARAQFEKTMFIILFSFCLYYVLFILFPSIGPQFYFPAEQRIVPEGYFFQKVMDFIISIGETQTGAFPSSHVGIAVISTILTGRSFKRILVLLIPIVLILILSTVYLKAHYAIDILAGLLSGVLFYYISNKIYNTRIFNISIKRIP